MSESHQSPQTDAEKSQASQTHYTHRTLGDEQESGGETRESQSYRRGRFGEKELDERKIRLSVSILGRRSRDSALDQTIREYSGRVREEEITSEREENLNILLESCRV